ncbi:MAG TPA: hypothetical protein VFW87_23060 [Pirellulales bacterium]|nr:hypothetical protein [Pirellulales bacterium]
MRFATLEPGNRVQLLGEWARGLCLRGMVALEKTSEGILVRPCPQTSWDEFFATGLEVGSAPPTADDEDELELTRDDYVF